MDKLSLEDKDSSGTGGNEKTETGSNASPSRGRGGPRRSRGRGRGAGRGGRGSAMAAFKQMDLANAPEGGVKANIGGGKTNPRSPGAIKEAMLKWCQVATANYENVNITNFSSSWNDGMAFCALIHRFRPDAFEYSSLDPKNRRENFQLAFDTAEKEADIAQLLEVDDMVKYKNPDWKCVFCYIQMFYRAFKDVDLTGRSDEDQERESADT